MPDKFFELTEYHVLLAVVGGAILLSYVLPRLLLRRAVPPYALLMLLGLLAFTLLPGMPLALDPLAAPRFWEVTSEFVVIVVLFATGLRIDSIGGMRRWVPTLRLLLIAMPLTIFAIAALGWAVAGMTVAGSLLLGAVLAPTDPVLAGDVQVGPPLEGGEDPARFILTTEAGLNDGLAFPFVYLGLLVASQGADPSGWLAEWILRDVLYRILVGAVLGAVIGRLLGQLLLVTPGSGGSGVIAFAAVLLCYGVVELAEGYGFIGAFVAGVACRRVEERSEFHRRLHLFSESIEHAVTVVLLFLLGSTLPLLWQFLDWRHAAVGLGLLLVVRPVAGWLSLLGTGIVGRDRIFVGFFGVRGVGSVYYLSYATGHIEFENEPQLWALVVFTILASTILHGTTSFFVVRSGKPGGS